MIKILPALIVSLSLLAPSIALAKCKMPGTPFIPNGDESSETEIQAAKIAVNAFVADLIDYRSCLEKKIASLGDKPNAYTKNQLEKKYNSSVDTEEYVVNTFNVQLRLFKSKKK